MKDLMLLLRRVLPKNWQPVSTDLQERRTTWRRIRRAVDVCLPPHYVIRRPKFRRRRNRVDPGSGHDISTTPIARERQGVFAGLLATATVSKGNKPNEDACRMLVGNADVRVLVLADGLGSSPGGGLAAAAAVGGAIVSARLSPPVSIEAIIQAAATAVGDGYRQRHGAVKADSQEWRTTFLIVRDKVDEIEFAWMGNGACWYACTASNEWPMAESEPASRLSLDLPRWMPLLQPHTVDRNGKPVLTRFLSPNRTDQASVIKLRKERGVRYVIVAVTDGISSWECTQHAVFRTDDARGDDRFHIWMGGNERLIFTLDCIAECLSDLTQSSWRDAPQDPSGILTNALDHCLAQMHKEGMIFDDATIGVMVSTEMSALEEETVGTLQR